MSFGGGGGGDEPPVWSVEGCGAASFIHHDLRCKRRLKQEVAIQRLRATAAVVLPGPGSQSARRRRKHLASVAFLWIPGPNEGHT